MEFGLAQLKDMYFFYGLSFAFNYSALVCLLALVEEEGRFSGTQVCLSIKLPLLKSKHYSYTRLKSVYLLSSVTCIHLTEKCYLTDFYIQPGKKKFTCRFIKGECRRKKQEIMFINISWTWRYAETSMFGYNWTPCREIILFRSDWLQLPTQKYCKADIRLLENLQYSAIRKHKSFLLLVHISRHPFSAALHFCPAILPADLDLPSFLPQMTSARLRRHPQGLTPM